jgi:hypothetical protein
MQRASVVALLSCVLLSSVLGAPPGHSASAIEDATIEPHNFLS